jgi:hypothetical protein
MSRNSASVRVGDFLGGKNVLRRLKKPSDTSDVPRFKTSTSRLVARKTTWVALGRRTVPHSDSIRGSRGRRQLRLGQSGVQTILWPQPIGEAGIRANACLVAPVFPTTLLDSVPLASGSSVIQRHDATQKLIQDQRVSRREPGQGENSPREGRREDPRHSQMATRRKSSIDSAGAAP